jgi:hypothetical protein
MLRSVFRPADLILRSEAFLEGEVGRLRMRPN